MLVSASEYNPSLEQKVNSQFVLDILEVGKNVDDLAKEQIIMASSRVKAAGFVICSG